MRIKNIAGLTWDGGDDGGSMTAEIIRNSKFSKTISWNQPWINTIKPN